MKIEKNDAKKIDKSTLQYLRDRAIDLRKNGKSNKETAFILLIDTLLISTPSFLRLGALY